ncbi:MAG: hypothetical protein RLZZ293_262, partial [Pseudomonadota bacterium]
MVKRTKPPVVDNTPTLLVELDLCIAKTVKNSDGVSELIVAGRDVYTHCLIVAQVAQHLIERFPNWLREKFFPKGSALIAGCHDLGKVSPSFQKKLYQNLSLPIIQDNIARLLACENISIDEKAWGGHAGVSGITIKLITNRSDLAKIVGQHHGYLASKSLFYKPTDSRFGGEEWLNLRKQLVKKLEQQMEQTFPVELLPIQEKVLSGLTTVADWIGSANHFNQADDCDWLAQIPHCLNEAGFIQPKIIADLSFMDIFAFQANSIQQQFINSVNAPGVYILEAPMGIGKTEAALYAAYKLLANNQAQGIYFALPTQLTSEKIYQRTQQFLDKILVTSVEKSQLMLVHSKSNSRMGEEANPDRSWFNQRKRRILAPFAVGTIDQALMAVLHVKHSFVRSFGLIGKVIIL